MNVHNKLDSVSKIAIFVDVKNMYDAAKAIQKKIDYKQLLNIVSDGRDVAAARAYVIMKKDSTTQKFVDSMRFQGYDCKTKMLDHFNPEIKDFQNWNVGMTIEMINWADKVDTVVLVSGSVNFVDVIEYIKRKVRVEIVNIREFSNQTLFYHCDSFIDLNQTDCLFDFESSNFEPEKEDE